ncbi:MAG TPA: 4'-phosphopantetheinyl transferase superfamily protein [Kofleriaceae bacterium]|jgi:4'-phosphopantetheinyl transferase|nr:4'-phosphopantetheinyl transferase superfamily protein [Kofleriaceae bacterium]
MTVTAVPPSSWLLPPVDLALGPSDAHVWRLSLTPPPEQVALLARTLSHDERERAARFYFDRDRIAFTVARGALRTLTGIYTGHAAQDLVFGYQAKGKPYLTSPPGDLHFNISHSGGVALLAFTRSREIGVDVEHRRPLQDLLSVANFSFSHQEYTTLCGLPAHEQIDAFFSCWSRKEAFIKTTGEGISQIRDFDVSMRPGEPARLLRVKDVLPGHERWSMHDLPAIADYAAALVVEGHDVQITCWDWPPTSPAAAQR